ncbi:MAG TPA: 5-deoxy-glucuronate isomerase [Vicinamibacterales bacterium]|jgi:5-deoxy-glucuronate isomerase
MNLPAIDPRTCIVRNTAAKKGRTRSVSPGVTAARHLHYGRIILDAGDPAVHVDPGTHETGLVCLKGRAVVVVGTKRFEMVPYDSIYVPHETVFDVAPGAGGCDLVELSAHVDNAYPLQFVSFAEIQKDSGLHFKTGGPNFVRTINLLLAKNVQAGRIVAGVTFTEPGHWSSWPPHEHAEMLEEAYLYVAMPPPAFGVQLVYTNASEPELATIVHEDDIVLMPQGYHPNIAAPGCSIGFLWMMAAEREGVDRQFGVVNVQPEFATMKSGLEAGQAK